MLWIMLAVLAAFGQALGWAIKKSALENKGLNHSLGAVAFVVAGGLFFALYAVMGVPAHTSQTFWLAAGGVIALNIVAVWAMYRALDSGIDFSTLMPFMALTSIAVVPVEYLIRGVLPHPMQIIGIIIVVMGAVIFSMRSWQREEVHGIGYFAITMACYSVAPALMAVAVQTSQSALFSAGVFHIGIAGGFFILVILARETAVWKSMSHIKVRQVLGVMILAGVVIALVENGPATVALKYASASEVFALKRLMPLFAMAIGYWYFHERQLTAQKVLGALAMVAGSAIIVWFH